MLLKLFKILRLLLHIFYGVGVVTYHALFKRRTINDPPFARAVSGWYQKSCEIIGLSVCVNGEPCTKPVLMVANHISWLDIVLLASVCNPRFLSKSEVRRWLLIGWAGEQLDTLFIKRGQRSASEAASAGIAAGLEAGDRILIFPEGTTTDGQAIGRIHARLFGAAISTETQVQPVVIHYTDANSESHSSELIPYIGEQTLIANLWKLLECERPTAYVYCLAPLSSAGKTRKALVAEVHAAMQRCLLESQTLQSARSQ